MMEALRRLIGVRSALVLVAGCSTAAPASTRTAERVTPLPTATMTPSPSTSASTALTAASLPPTASTAAQVVQFKTVVEKFATTDLFSGAALVAKDRSPIFKQAHGRSFILRTTLSHVIRDPSMLLVP